MKTKWKSTGGYNEMKTLRHHSASLNTNIFPFFPDHKGKSSNEKEDNVALIQVTV